MDDEITCAICQKSLDNVKDVVTLREKGREGINRASTERYDIIQPATVKRYTKHTAAHTATQLTSPELRNRRVPFHNYLLSSSRRSFDRKTEKSFNFKTDCLFCETKVDFEEPEKRRQGGVFRVTTLETKDTV